MSVPSFNLNSFITSLDCYGSSYKFTINKEKRFKSIYGGLSTCIAISIFTIYFCFRIKQLINKDNTKNDFYILTEANSNIKINDYENFMIVSCLTVTTNFTTMDKYADSALNHTFRFAETYRRPWLIENYEYINIKQCEISDFPKGFMTPPLFPKFSQCKCIPNKVLQKFRLVNFFTAEYYTYFEYGVKFKDEVYRNQTKSAEFTRYFKLNNPRLITFFIETDVNLDANENENQKFVVDNFNMNIDYINLDFTLRSDLFLKTIQFQSDLHETIGIFNIKIIN